MRQQPVRQKTVPSAQPLPQTPVQVQDGTSLPALPVKSAGTALDAAGTPAGATETPKAAPKTEKSAPRKSAGQKAGARVSLPLSKGTVAAGWQPLLARLQSDNMGDPAYAAFFADLPDYSPAPMAVKIKELFTNAFLRKKRTGTQPAGDPKARIYRGVVTQDAMDKCAAFLKAHKTAFAAVEKKYPVPKEMIVALLFVETRLGTYLGDSNAFWSLAGMAAATSPELMKDGIADLPLTDEHAEWLQAKLTDKSEWAYKELKALMRFCRLNNLDPKNMPGSVYGAIGLCQFMPSNLIPYGDDGDGDGVIDLFNPPDAIASAAKYLTAHGWKKDINLDQQRKVLRRYNNLQTYANTIITLGESLQQNVLQTAPSDAETEKQTASKSGVKKGSVTKKAPAKKGSVKKGSAIKKAPTPKAVPRKVDPKNVAPKKVAPRKVIP